METMKEEREGRTVLKLTGEITVYEVDDLRNELLDYLGNNDNPVFDLSELGECDTAGIQVLYSAKKTVIDQEKKFTVSGMSDAFRNSMDRIGLDGEDFLKADKEG